MYESEADRAGPVPSIEPLDPATDARTLALQRRVKELEARVLDLQRELEEARASVAIDVDLSDVARADASRDDPYELQRRVRHDPRDATTLHALHRAWLERGEVDRAWCVAHVLDWLGAAEPTEKRLYEERRGDALIRPKTPVSSEAWVRLLAHPDQEPTASAIFSVVAPAVLLGRVSNLRRDKKLPRFDETKRQDPAQSTVQAVRAFAWAAATLGMTTPPIYVDPEWDGGARLELAMPPVIRMGAHALSGRNAAELAFLVGRQLAWHRAENLVRLLVPEVPALEEVFLAALSIGNPGLPMNEKMRQLVVPIAQAIEPILEPAAVDRLRGHFLRFVEEGGRTNLQRWAHAVDRTAARAGLLLANDLSAAAAMLALEDPAHAGETMNDLVEFTTSDRYSRLRKQIGIAIAAS
jgi:hypothetical protein